MTLQQPPASDNFQAAQRYFADAPALYIPLPVPAGASANQPVKGIPVGTSPWWIERLTRAMWKREARLVRLRNYYRGEQDTWRLSNEAFRYTFGRAFWGMKANLMSLVVKSAGDRLRVDGFRVPLPEMAGPEPLEPGETATSADLDETDDEAWRIWQANKLDSRASVAFAEALASGECPILIQPNPKDPKTPRITVEDPQQVVVERDPADPSERLAALKRFTDTDGMIVHILYLPDRIEWWRQYPTSAAGNEQWGWVAPMNGGMMAFQLRGYHYELDASKSGANKVGVVPVVMLVNNPRIDGTGEAEHEQVIPLQDLYNKTLMDMMTTSEFSAHKQRWAVGISLDEEADATDSSGNVTMPAGSPMKAAVNRVWSTENPDARFGEFSEANLGPYVEALNAIRSDIGTITMTPYHYLLAAPTSVPPTGESLKSAETPLVQKVKQKHLHLGEGLEEVMHVAFLTAGDTARAAVVDMEVHWANPEARIMSVLADALTKLGVIGVPEPALWTLWGFTPQEQAQFPAMRAASQPPESPVRITEPVAPASNVDAASGDGNAARPAATMVPTMPMMPKVPSRTMPNGPVA